MLKKRASQLLIWSILSLVSVALCGCAQAPSEPVSEKKEEPVIPALPPQNPEALDSKQLTKLPPPKPAEVKAAMERVFQNAAVMDTSRNPYFLVGDFNGDYSQDLAVIITPAQGKILEMNKEYPTWMLRDPYNPNLPPQLRKEPLHVVDNDVLLAVIHGYGANGWRTPEATQTYLLKNAVGSRLDAQPTSVALTTYKGKNIPKLFGDTITQVLEGRTGFLYYTGAGYAWYDQKTYKPETERRLAHNAVAARK